MSKFKRKLNKTGEKASEINLEKRRKTVENTAAFGLIIICVALALPFASAFSPVWIQVGKWTYTAGTAIFLVARCFNVSDPDESLRIRRMRRMEAWAGLAFTFGAFFWFWNEAHLGPLAGPLAILRETVMFAIAGALIQLIASWMIYFRTKKEIDNNGGNGKR